MRPYLKKEKRAGGWYNVCLTRANKEKIHHSVFFHFS
jgi:hypothetical protein